MSSRSSDTLARLAEYAAWQLYCAALAEASSADKPSPFDDLDHRAAMHRARVEGVFTAAELLGDAMQYMKEEMIMQVGFESDTPIFARPPKVVELEVTYTEHAVKGDTSNKVMKAAKLETGAEVSVPSFVDIGTVVRIDTETGEYLDRVKK